MVVLVVVDGMTPKAMIFSRTVCLPSQRDLVGNSNVCVCMCVCVCTCRVGLRDG